MPLTETKLHALETRLAMLIGPEFVDQARTVLPRLFAEIRELRKDAKRLDFLVQAVALSKWEVEELVTVFRYKGKCHGNIRKAIDAAMEGGQNVRATDRRATAGD